MYDSYHLISTPENVDLRLELAGAGNRVLACFIDTLITYLLITLLWIIILLTGAGLGWVTQHFHLDYNTFNVFIALVALGTLGSFLITFGYFIFFEGLWHGQTPGKKIAGIRVVRENGEPVSWQAVLLRNVLRTFDEGVFLIGLIFMVVEKDEKRTGDLAAGTVVIRERKAVMQTQTGSASLAPTSQLNQADYELLSNFLWRRKYMFKQPRLDLSQKIAAYLYAKLNNGQVGAGQSSAHPPGNPEAYLEKLAGM